MELVMSVCRQPFVELRLAGLQILQVLAEQQWGQERMNSTPGKPFIIINTQIKCNVFLKMY
jgi:26S proteasome non-ATPase regulatory subunit 5